ncbi:KH domain-containing, RNA-binding, signal transduction-associated protein 3-like [Eupeodes corollae]|uniref:KH domain-containing, RNA-binding, signal transduction-associated protein 3-like n=1 Tax=Eupeodes corollae TaxID=290404 RepID=UPI0024932620|nr:KH domain-containing, RNA-binding, signal transduction-associated protein 3-like [Eupeodes corollae]
MRDSSPVAEVQAVEDEGHPPRLNEMSKKFIADCIAEKERLSNDFPVAAMLINEAIDRVHATGRIPGREMHADVFKQKLIKVTQKVFVPTKQFPNFNFNGKILGPKGNSLRNLQKQTLCRILIKGRNSMRNAEKEQELRESGDPRHAHLEKDLYVEISTVATPAEAHARIAYALAEIRKYLIPDSNDEVSQSQRKEMSEDPEFIRKSGKSFSDDRGQSKPRVSILQKITGYTGQSYDNGMDGIEDGNDEEERTPARGALHRPPMKRSMQEPPSPYQNRNTGERQTYRSDGRPVVSILKKVTGYKDYEEEDERQEGGIEYDPEYPDERSYSRDPIRQMSQRPSGKRFVHEQPSSFQQRRYENPQKRTRDVIFEGKNY